MHGKTTLSLFEELRTIARESRLIQATSQFELFVGTVRTILAQVGDLLDLRVWEGLTFNPEFRWPGIHKRRRSIRARRAMLRKYERRLRNESVTLDKVRLALEFARKQVLAMFSEIHVVLLRGDAKIPTDLSAGSALNLLELTAGFRRNWRQLSRDLASQCRRRHHGV